MKTDIRDIIENVAGIVLAFGLTAFSMYVMLSAFTIN